MRIIRNWFLSLAWALFLLHSWVPHHHHDEDGQSVCIEEEQSEDFLDLLSFMFHEDLGEHHLEHVSLEQVSIPGFFPNVAESTIPNGLSNAVVLLDGNVERDLLSEEVAASCKRGPPPLNV